MAKQSKGRRVGETSAMAKVVNLRTSPRKLGLVAQSIRGLPVQRALNELEFSHKRITVKGFVGNQAIKGDALDPRRHINAVVAVPRHEPKAHQIAQRVCQRQDLGCHAAFRASDGLALSPPFAPCP